MLLHSRWALPYIWAVFFLGVEALIPDHAVNLQDLVVSQGHSLTPNHLPRGLEANSTNSNSTNSNSTLLAAEQLIKVAQEEARVRNAYLIAHPRLNTYKFRDFGVVRPIDDTTGTGNNASVAIAAVIVTDSLVSNGTLGLKATGSNLEKRQTAGWWMEGMIQNGKSPYVSNSTYNVSYVASVSNVLQGADLQVWRNVKSYGAVGDGQTDGMNSFFFHYCSRDGQLVWLKVGRASSRHIFDLAHDIDLFPRHCCHQSRNY